MSDTSEQQQSSQRDAGTNDQQDNQQRDGDQLGDKGKLALDREREARADADRRAREAERKLAAHETERKQVDDEAAAKRGEFEKLANERSATITDLDGKLKVADTDRKAIEEERDALRAFFDGQIDAALKTLPDALKDFDPGPDAPFAQRKDWLEKAQKRAAELGDQPTQRGNGPNPKPGGEHKIDIEAEARKARQTGRYSV